MSLPPCRRIVVGSDLSRGSDAAVRLAIAWAAQTHAELLILHAATALTDAGRADLEKSLRVQAMESAAEEMGLEPQFAVVLDDAVHALRAAASRDGDWLCVGCEGGSATVLRQAGSIASALAAATSRPLLLAPLGWSAPARRRARVPGGSGLPARKRVSAAFGRVLVGMPGTTRDAALIGAGIDQAIAAGGGLALAHVIDVAATRFHPPALRGALREQTDAAVLSEKERLTDLSNELVPLDLAARQDVQIHVMVQGPPERDLAGLARSQSSELLLVGSGPVAGRLPAFLGCPALVLPVSC